MTGVLTKRGNLVAEIGIEENNIKRHRKETTINQGEKPGTDFSP